LVDPQRTPYPQSGHTSTIDQAHKVRQLQTDVLTTEPRRHNVKHHCNIKR